MNPLMFSTHFEMFLGQFEVFLEHFEMFLLINFFIYFFKLYHDYIIRYILYHIISIKWLLVITIMSPSKIFLRLYVSRWFHRDLSQGWLCMWLFEKLGTCTRRVQLMQLLDPFFFARASTRTWSNQHSSVSCSVIKHAHLLSNVWFHYFKWPVTRRNILFWTTDSAQWRLIATLSSTAVYLSGYYGYKSSISVYNFSVHIYRYICLFTVYIFMPVQFIYIFIYIYSPRSVFFPFHTAY